MVLCGLSSMVNSTWRSVLSSENLPLPPSFGIDRDRVAKDTGQTDS